MRIRQGNGAVIVEPYRYSLWRTWNPARPRLLWVLLNPSTADDITGDQTLSRCIGFSKEWCYGGLEIVNLFAFRNPDWRTLMTTLDAIGPENDAYIIGPENDAYIADATTRAADIMVGWGEHGTYLGRDRAVLALRARHSDRPLRCLGTIANGSPCHPSRQKATLRPVPYL